MTLSGPLILILTRRCNLRCGFCPQGFAPRDMSPAVLRAAIEGLGPRLRAPRRVKFFGGEPLLRAPFFAEAVESARRAWPDCAFQLSTNGTLLDERVCRFLRAHPEVEISLGRLSPWLPYLPNASFNLLLPPGEDPVRTMERFSSAVSAGLRRFNFLPAYFAPWSAAEISRLRRAFAGLSRLIASLGRRGTALEVKNLAQSGSIPLYNDGLTVDTDGTLYASNLILARRAARHAGRLRVGHVRRPRRIAAPADSPRAVLQDSFGPRTLAQARLVDQALDEFVHALS